MSEAEDSVLRLVDGELRELVRLMDEANIEELHLEKGDFKVHLRKGALRGPGALDSGPRVEAAASGADSPRISAQSSLVEKAPLAQAAPEVSPTLQAVRAPVVGTFFATPDPRSRPYVQEGDLVEKGQVVGIIEAMKMMNEVEAELSGRVAKVLVANNTPVEYGQKLMLIEPVEGVGQRPQAI
ncbi:MAG: acetyl-CoA carboxylase biotin carboxyl carrier protein [Chloroflexi bacterium]|nr:acetyl-CoA carboxylase biotin carboxyl carrier protein [Chloroflexota bacterium]